MPTKRVKVKAPVYKFKPAIHQIAAQEQRVVSMAVQRLVVKDVLKGMSYEDISTKRKISPEEAKDYAKKAIDRWAGDLGHTATEHRELDLKRMDALLERLHPLVFPEPYIDEALGTLVSPNPDIPASKLYLDILSQRSKLLGTEAAHKLEAEKTEMLKRMYIGVPNTKGVIDL